MYKFGRIPGAHACDHGLGVQAKVCVAFCVKYSSDVEPYTIYKLGTYRKGSRDGAWQAYRRQIIPANIFETFLCLVCLGGFSDTKYLEPYPRLNLFRQVTKRRRGGWGLPVTTAFPETVYAYVMKKTFFMYRTPCVIPNDWTSTEGGGGTSLHLHVTTACPDGH